MYLQGQGQTACIVKIVSLTKFYNFFMSPTRK